MNRSGNPLLKTIFVVPQGIRAGWRFAIFAFLLFGFSRLFFWILTVFLHYQEHPGWSPTDFLLDGALSFGAALLAAWIMSKPNDGRFLVWPSMAGNVPQAFPAGHFMGARLVVTHDRFAHPLRRRFFRGRGGAWANF